MFPPNKSLPADVHVRIRGRVVQIPVEQPCIRPVRPVASKVSKRASLAPFYQIFKTAGDSRPPHPLKRFLKKPPAEAHAREPVGQRDLGQRQQHGRARSRPEHHGERDADRDHEQAETQEHGVRPGPGCVRARRSCLPGRGSGAAPGDGVRPRRCGPGATGAATADPRRRGA